MSASRASRGEVGRWGEALAAKYLRERGYTILAQNWRHGHGELDIIAKLADQHIFVEVRTRRSDAFGTAEESITPHKQQTLIATAQAFLLAHNLMPDEVDWQIDVITVSLKPNHQVETLQHYPAALSQ